MYTEYTPPPIHYEQPSLLISAPVDGRIRPIRSPLDNNLWLRKFPNKKSPVHNRPIGASVDMEPREGMLTAVRHLARLAEIGVIQPTLAYYFADDHLFTVSEHVWGINLEEAKGQRRTEWREKRGQQLHGYLDWIQTDGEKVILWDVLAPSQQRVGLTQSDEARHLPEQAYLIDTDPIMELASPAKLCTYRYAIDGSYGLSGQSA